MKKIFMCSLCHGGLLGGVLYLEPNYLTYKTNKLTIDKKYKNLVMPIKEIKDISWKWVLFPIATINMRNGDRYRIMIYNKSRFMRCYEKYSIEIKG